MVGGVEISWANDAMVDRGTGGEVIIALVMIAASGFLLGAGGATFTVLGKTIELRSNTVSRITNSTTPQRAAAMTISPVNRGCRIKTFPTEDLPATENSGGIAYQLKARAYFSTLFPGDLAISLGQGNFPIKRLSYRRGYRQ